MKKLYYIENHGCDATTRGLVELTDGEIDLVVELVKNLNKNSYYGCMPTIEIYEADWEYLRIVDEPIPDDCFEEGYVDKDQQFHLNEKIYTWAWRWGAEYDKLKQII